VPFGIHFYSSSLWGRQKHTRERHQDGSKTSKGDKMTLSETKSFDPAEYLDDPEAIAAYMTDALESDDPAFITDALGVVARARGMSQVAQDAGLSRENLYRALSANGNPEFATVLHVLQALGLQFSVVTANRQKVA
jgi:probable addiction module antidote protein